MPFRPRFVRSRSIPSAPRRPADQRREVRRFHREGGTSCWKNGGSATSVALLAAELTPGVRVPRPDGLPRAGTAWLRLETSDGAVATDRVVWVR